MDFRSMFSPFMACHEDYVLKENQSLAETIFLKGYQAEFGRMKDIHIRCNHLKYSSISAFFKSVEIIRRKQLKNEIEFEDDEFTDLIGSGFCRKCSTHITSNIMHIAGFDQFMRKKMHSYCTEECDQRLVYFVNCLQHPITANHIFNQSRIWNVMLLHLSVLLNDIRLRQKRKMDNIEYQNIALLLFQLVRNIKIIKRFHWELIAEHQIAFMHWLQFVKSQLMINNVFRLRFTYESIFCLLVLVTYTLYHINDDTLSIMKEYHQFEGMKKWFRDLQRIKTSFAMDISDSRYHHILNSFLSLQHKDQLDKLYDVFKTQASRVHEIKRNDTKCQNLCCLKKRFETKLYKCSLCQVSCYCSKHCQKVDWNRNGHKRICRKLTKTRQKNKNTKKVYLIELLNDIEQTCTFVG